MNLLPKYGFASIIAPVIQGAIVGAILWVGVGSPAEAGVVDPELEARLKAVGPDEPVPVIVTLSSRANLNVIRDRTKAVRRRKVIQTLQATADRTQGPLLTFLRNNSATRVKPLWIINGIAVQLPARVVPALAGRPGVARVQLDATLSAPEPLASVTAPPEWNIDAIHAPEVWGLGYTGQSIVVASMDTGVDVDHPDLAPRYRGGGNSWFDPHGEHPTIPTDVAGHGTQTMGLMVAGDAGGTSVGVAPGAQWIAVKVFDDAGNAQETDFLQGFEWLLDPDGDPLTDDAPDVVNGSYQIAGADICDTRFETVIQNLKTASVAVVFAAGNDGPGGATSVSPANNPSGYGIGAVDETSAVAGFSSRGPSACDENLVFPKLVAPGVGINTTDLSFGGFPFFITVEGTSFAAPHVAGGMALLLSAFPNTAVSTLEAALTDSATDLGEPGPDNDYGYGLLHVKQAHDQLNAGAQSPVAMEDSFTVDEDMTLAVVMPGLLDNDTDPQNDPLTAELVSDVSHGSLALYADGSFDYTPAPNYQGTDSFTYRALDPALHESGPATVLITVNPINDPPVAVNDGPYAVIGGATLTVAAPGLLQNDIDIDEDSLLAQGPSQTPAHGSVTVNTDGSFTYTANLGYAGADSFSYLACDPANACDPATVNIDVAATNQLDADGDGVSNALDQCPETPAGELVGADGCPLPQTAPVLLYLSLTKSKGTLAGLGPDGSNLAYRDEDILSWNGTHFDMIFDGSAAGLPGRADVVAFDVNADRILLAFNAPVNVPGVAGTVDDSDIVAYDRETRGFSLYFDGSDVGLDGNADRLDAVDLLADGTLLISTRGNPSIPGLRSVADEDLLAFSPASLGEATSGSWSIYFDGSDVGLRDGRNAENVDAAAVAANGDIYLSTRGSFAVAGLSGEDQDVFVCTPSSLGASTACSFSPYFEGSAFGLAAEDMDAINLP